MTCSQEDDNMWHNINGLLWMNGIVQQTWMNEDNNPFIFPLKYNKGLWVETWGKI